ncbi:MAG: right-handed parallel beta-helix repeat-containing protein, partial [bacterium]|nr:right-handed parallel beta-helix repeat-containing protein [bacterium]
PFATIQHAVDVMSSGVPACTSATTYVFPGSYNSPVLILSNRNSGYMVITKLSNSSPLMRVMGSGYGFRLNNVPRVIIDNMTVFASSGNGIIIDGTSVSNYIRYNTLYSNSNNEIMVAGSAVNKIFIISNTLFNGQRGLFVQEAGRSLFKGNTISGYPNNEGIRMERNEGNILRDNEVFACRSGMTAEFVTNLVMRDNKVHHIGQTGLSFSLAYQSMVSNNSIYRCATNNTGAAGISVNNHTKYLTIRNNTLYSNVRQETNFSYGIFIQATQGSNISVLTNNIYGVSPGVFNCGADFVRISRNYIHDLPGKWGNAIEVNTNQESGSGTNNHAYNNTVNSNTIRSRGISISWGSNHTLVGNSIEQLPTQQAVNVYRSGHLVFNGNTIRYAWNGAELNNVNGTMNDNTIEYIKGGGLRLSSVRDSAVSNNTIRRCGITNSGWGYGINIDNDAKNVRILNNLIYSNVADETNFREGISIGSCVATNILILSNEVYGMGTAIRNDGGDYIYIRRNYLHNNKFGNIQIWSNNFSPSSTRPYYNTISSNLLTGSGLSLSYGEGHMIQGNMIRNALITDFWGNSIMSVSHVSNLNMSANTITNSGSGVSLNDVQSADVFRNTLVSNLNGISLNDDFNLIGIRFNTIKMRTNEGISIRSRIGRNVVVFSNTILGAGVALRNQSADNIEIRENRFLECRWGGIEMSTNNETGIPSPLIYSNTIISNTVTGNGINLSGVRGLLVQGNRISDIVRHTNSWDTALSFQNVSNAEVKRNEIRNTLTAMECNHLNDSRVTYNTMVSNGVGIVIKDPCYGLAIRWNLVTACTSSAFRFGPDDLAATQIEVRRNNFISNPRNVEARTNLDIRSNWWGTSLRADILGSFDYGSTVPAFIPYRLWREYNLEEGADTDNLENVTGFTCEAAGTLANLRWNRNTDADRENYYVYRSFNPDNGLLQHTPAYVIAITTNTNFSDTPAGGMYSYWVTAGDDPSPPAGSILTNESWYSVMQTVTVGTGTNVYNYTQDKWYWNIQSAVDAAATDDVLHVRHTGYPVSGSGIYNERIEFSDKGASTATRLTIVSSNWLRTGDVSTILDGTGNTHTVVIGSNRRVKLHGFKIKNDTWDGCGILITGGSSGNLITHNLIYSNNPTWSDNAMPPFGLIVDHGRCSSNVIASNEFRNNLYDLALLGGHDNSVFSNRFHDSGYLAVAIGDYPGPTRKNRVWNNLIHHQGKNGFTFYGTTSSNTVISNVVRDCTNAFTVEKSGGPSDPPVGPGVQFNRVAYNSFYRNKNGIVLVDHSFASGNVFSHNIITNNMDNGIIIVSTNSSTNSMDNLFATNLITGNTTGVYFQQVSNFSLISNVIRNNQNGVSVRDSAGLVIKRNVIRQNVQIGCWMTNSGMLFNLNDIASNATGVYLAALSGSCSRNNVYDNSSWNVSVTASPGGPGSIGLTNN